MADRLRGRAWTVVGVASIPMDRPSSIERTVTVVGDAFWIFATGDLVVRSATGEVRRPYIVTCIFENIGGPLAMAAVLRVRA